MQLTETNRRDFVKTSAAAGAAALFAGVGFNRIAQAQDTSELITQLVTFNFDADKKEEATKALAGLASAVEEKEPGVLAYIPHTYESGDTHQIVFFEVYENAAALAAHGSQPHLGELRALFGTVFTPPFDIKKLDRIGGYSR